jgi:hypothetical protein
MAKKINTKKHSKFLMTMIIIMGLLILGNIIGYLSDDMYINPQTTAPEWVLNLAKISIYAEAVIVAGVYLWKKWAVWTHLVIQIFSIIFSQIYVVSPPILDIEVWAYAFAGILMLSIYILYFWAIYRQWKYFS